MTRLFDEEYSRTFEAYFPLSQEQVLLNLSSQEYVLGELGLWGRKLKKYKENGQPCLGDTAITGIC